MSDASPNDALVDAEQSYGWLLFASIVLICAGIMRILDAIWAWRYNGVLPDEFQKAVLGNDLDTYGWLWLIVGIVLILAGLAVMQRSQWARLDRHPCRRHPDHHSDHVDALLSRVVTHLHLGRHLRDLRARRPRRTAPPARVVAVVTVEPLTEGASITRNGPRPGGPRTAVGDAEELSRR